MFRALAGLGKTLQATAMLATVVAEGRARASAPAASSAAPPAPPRPSLVVCPPTLVGHWGHEIARYVLPPHSLRVVLYAGAPAARSRLAGPSAKHLRASDVVVASYDTVRGDVELLASVEWDFVVLDEGHAIRNPKTAVTRAVKRLTATHRCLLSGTPIQNSVEELWSLFDFLMPGFLGTEAQFRKRYGGGGSKQAATLDALALGALHAQVRPFILRRLKADVLSELPPKMVSDVFVDPSPLQRALAEDFAASGARAEAAASLAGGGGGSGGGGDAEQQKPAFAAIQYMRTVCAHPAMALRGAPPGRVAALAARLGGAAAAVDPAAWLRRPEHAPKLGALAQLLREAGIGAAGGGEETAGPATGGAAAGDASQSQPPPAPPAAPHRALVFAQLRGMLDAVETGVFGPGGLLPGVSYLRLDGSVETSRRFDLARRFCSDPSISVLLLTTAVGGLGLNLTAADTVIFLEHDWNPQRDLQAMDRAHRLGQTRAVSVYRLLTRDTIEARIMSLQQWKIDVAEAVVASDNASITSLDTGALIELFGTDAAAPATTAAAEKAAAEEAARERGVEPAGAPKGGAAAALAGLQELWDEAQYAEELSLDGFVARL